MTLRAPTLIDQHLELLSRSIAGERDWHYAERLRGADHGLRWMRDGGESPISKRFVPQPDRFDIYDEMEWAGEVENGVRSMPDGMVKEYASGVFSSLAWGSGDSDLSPG